MESRAAAGCQVPRAGWRGRRATWRDSQPSPRPTSACRRLRADTNPAAASPHRSRLRRHRRRGPGSSARSPAPVQRHQHVGRPGVKLGLVATGGENAGIGVVAQILEQKVFVGLVHRMDRRRAQAPSSIRWRPICTKGRTSSCGGGASMTTADPRGRLSRKYFRNEASPASSRSPASPQPARRTKSARSLSRSEVAKAGISLQVGHRRPLSFNGKCHRKPLVRQQRRPAAPPIRPARRRRRSASSQPSSNTCSGSSRR